MAFMNYLLTIIATFLICTQAIPTISVTGSKFFTSDGKQFFIKGVAYQLIEDDPLVNTAQCQRDAALMKTLGANSIRVYHVDGTADHSGCMNAFAAAGIYLWVDLDSFKTYIAVGGSPSWTQNKSASYRQVMDNFQQYDNTAGFFVGNEVLNSKADSGSAPFLLSATVDLRAYGKAKGYRPIPIGYSATDTGDLRPFLQDYLVCRPNATERLDFYSLNSYEWCGHNNFQTSGYMGLQSASQDYPVPVFFSEDGCNTAPPRTFEDQAAIFGPDMSGTWSGAIIYEWIQETNQYGLINYGPQRDASVNQGSSIIQGFTRQGVPTPIQPDFQNLQAQWATLTPTGVNSAQYAATFKTTPRSCPAYSSTGWTVNPQAVLPTLGAAAISGMTSGLPSGIPRGSITVTTPSPNGQATSLSTLTTSTLVPTSPLVSTTSFTSSSSPSSTTNSLITGSTTTSQTSQTPSTSTTRSSSTSASSQAAGIRMAHNPVGRLPLSEVNFCHAFAALAAISIGAMIWL